MVDLIIGNYSNRTFRETVELGIALLDGGNCAIQVVFCSFVFAHVEYIYLCRRDSFSKELLKSSAVNGVSILMDIETHTYTVSLLLSVDCVAFSDNWTPCLGV